MTAPVGPTGLAQRCTGKHADDAEPLPTHRFGLGAAGVQTVLLIGPDRLRMEQLAFTAQLQVHFGSKRTLSVGAGALLGGTLASDSAQYHLGPGGTASVGYSQLVVEPKGAVPFVMLSGSLAVTHAPTRIGTYFAADVRAGVAVGWLLFDRFTPYATTRVFGGPVFWRGQTGTDQFHFQLGAGFVLGLPGGFDVVVECVPLGEQALSAGVGFSF